MQKKALIVTMVENQYNYGQRLQAYALQKFLQDKFDLDSYILDYRSRKEKDFEEFEEKHMKFINKGNSRSLNPDFTIFGGDQIFIWIKKFVINKFIIKTKELYNKCLFSYASSDAGKYFGNPEEAKNPLYNNLISLLDNFKGISIREKSTKEFLEHKFKRKVFNHLDPVYLLTKDDYISLMEKPKFIKEDKPFNFTYTAYKRDEKYFYYDEKNNSYVQTFNQQYKVSSGNLTMGEFLWMIYHCNNFYTTSFHGMSLALILNRKFEIKNNDSRIETAKAKFNLKDMNNIDYENVNKIIENGRNESYDYLRRMLNEEYTFLGTSKSKEIVKKSATNGVVTELSRKVIQEGGVVYGVRFSEDYRKAFYIAVNKEEDLDLLAGCKYVEAEAPPFNSIVEDLKTKKVLFVGVPCWVNALHSFINNTNKELFNNLTTISLICHAEPLSKEWIKYLDNIESSSKQKITRLYFERRTKRIRVYSGDKLIKFDLSWLRKFLNDKSVVCAKCLKCFNKFPFIETDFIIGDSWGLEKYNEKYEIGNLIFCMNKKAIEILKSNENIKIKEIPTEEALRQSKLKNRRLFSHK